MLSPHGPAQPIDLQEEEGRDMTCFLCRLDPGKGGPRRPHAHDHAHVVVVLRGTATVRTREGDRELAEGGVVLIPSGTPHSIWNRSSKALETIFLDLGGGAPAAEAKTEAGKKGDFAARKDEVLRLTNSFCRRYLDHEYRMLCEKMVKKLCLAEEESFLKGKPEAWAAGIIHALGSNNLLFSTWCEPYVAVSEITAFFGISYSSMHARSRKIMDLFGMETLEREFSTPTMAMIFGNLADLLYPSSLPEGASVTRAIAESRRRGWERARARSGWRREYTNIYQFRIYLVESDPLIWRRIQVPGDYTFWDLHVAIQDAMGWLDYHLHMFSLPRPGGIKLEHIGIPDEEDLDIGAFGEPFPLLPGWEENIADWFTPENALASYEYDFGDGWVHGIELEEILPREPGASYPRCLDGWGACPPEDCGGTDGYYRMLRILADPSHPEREEYLRWLGGDFDPRDFDPQEVGFDDPARRFLEVFSD